METSAKNPDQISGSHRTRECTMAASLYCKNILVRQNSTFIYTWKVENVCEEMREGKITKFIKIYEGHYFNKIAFTL